MATKKSKNQINEMFKEASQKKLRIPTSRGSLSVEQLWDLNLTELDEIAVKLEEEKNKTSKSFLEEKSDEDELAALQFNIVLDILDTKKKWQEDARKAQERKEQKQKILQVMQKKQDEKLEEYSVEQLEEMLEKL